MPETWPTDIIARDAEFWLQSHTAQFASPLNRKVEVQAFPGGTRWMLRLDFFLPRTKARRVDAFLARLRGALGTFRCWDHDRPTPENGLTPHGAWVAGQTFPEPFSDTTLFTDGTGFAVTARPYALRAGAARGATVLSFDGAEPNGDGLVEGDYIQLGDYLHMIVGATDPDGNGWQSITIEPPLKADTSATATMVLDKPTAEFRLVDDDQVRNPSDNVHFYRYSLTAAEVL